MLPLLSLHAIAALRGDGLHPALLASLKRLAAERGEGAAAKDCGEQEERVAGPTADRVMATNREATARLPTAWPTSNDLVQMHEIVATPRPTRPFFKKG